MEALAGAVVRATQAQAGKYLTFQLGPEIYGIPILKVQEIIGLMNITPVPRTPAFMRGIINLRGKIIPVVDLRAKFCLERHADTERTCIIVVEVARGNGRVVMGVIVDEVSEVLDIALGQLEPTPSFGAGDELDFITGIGKVGQKVVMLLDMDGLFTGDEMAGLAAQS
jgi:purine-binding chemotaxis protein CheW